MFYYAGFNVERKVLKSTFDQTTTDYCVSKYY